MTVADEPQTARVKRRSLPPAGGSVYSLSESETYELGRTLGRGLSEGDLVLLEGPLGIGKTVFARGIAAGLGIPPEQVCSPSFTLVQEYAGGRAPMFHIDLYRIEEVEEFDTLGLEELTTSGAVVVVEWGERLPAAYRRDAVTVRLHDIGESSRRIELLGSTKASPAPPNNH
jgi:tRNA threonylcarbamoyladenosine biosynthesis protein TsaE